MEHIIIISIFVFSLTIHEYSHAYAALILGDTTARDQGRLTLNPLKHLDILGTLVILIIGFGWAKPVPVIENNLIKKRRSLYIVALAGPLSNIILAIFFTLCFHIFSNEIEYATMRDSFKLSSFLYTMVYVNIILAIFNLFPIPPLDGSNIIYSFLPDKIAKEYMRILYKYSILWFFIIFLFLNTFSNVIFKPIRLILNFLI